MAVMSIAGYLHEFAARCGPVVGHSLDTSITLRYRGITARVASSTAAAARCDQVEAREGSGPCIDAMDQMDIQLVTSIADADAWVVWRDAAAGEGFVTAGAIPAEVVPNMNLALNIYSRSAEVWSGGLLKSLTAYAELAAAAVRLHLDVALASEELDAERPVSDHEIVERAIGAIMHLNNCTDTQARDLIEHAALAREVTKRDVAATILGALVPAVVDDLA